MRSLPSDIGRRLFDVEKNALCLPGYEEHTFLILLSPPQRHLSIKHPIKSH